MDEENHANNAIKKQLDNGNEVKVPSENDTIGNNKPIGKLDMSQQNQSEGTQNGSKIEKQNGPNPRRKSISENSGLIRRELNYMMSTDHGGPFQDDPRLRNKGLEGLLTPTPSPVMMKTQSLSCGLERTNGHSQSYPQTDNKRFQYQSAFEQTHMQFTYKFACDMHDFSNAALKDLGMDLANLIKLRKQSQMKTKQISERTVVAVLDIVLLEIFRSTSTDYHWEDETALKDLYESFDELMTLYGYSAVGQNGKEWRKMVQDQSLNSKFVDPKGLKEALVHATKMF